MTLRICLITWQQRRDLEGKLVWDRRCFENRWGLFGLEFDSSAFRHGE